LSKRNRRGILYLVLFGIAISYTPRLLTYLQDESEINITKEELQQLDEEFKDSKRSYKSTNRSDKRKTKYTRPSGKFDPNTYSVEDWKKLGLSEKQAGVIVRFTKHGIQSNEELKNVYVISDELFDLIKDSTYYSERNKNEREPKEKISIDINSGTENELQTIPGIGPFYAKKIVEHRSMLGGYVRIEQLLEIWKFDADKLEEIRPFITKSDMVQKISVNLAGVDELKKHPYIEYKVANSIVKMREIHGEYSSLDDLKRSKLVDEELLIKLKPYIKL
jgi:DNA uptake protein ComE-like DNA-binding protein